MTYFNRIVPMRMIEVTLSSAQTASQGDYVLFDTIRATGTHGVTVNSSNWDFNEYLSLVHIGRPTIMIMQLPS